MYQLIRSALFLLSAETAHHFTLFMLRVPGLSRLAGHVNTDPRLRRKVFGLEFRNPVGLAAGLDKDALAFEELGQLGFGFIEIGTVTPLAQPGNDKPRLFRLKKDKALINRMGFNNKGALAAARRLKRRNKNSGLIIGGNIGKNKVTPNEKAVDDYLSCFDTLYPYADYFVVNVSSPNTPNLRALQEKEPLTHLLLELQKRNRQKGPKPLLLKIAPDLTDQQLDDIIDIVKSTGIHGVIATNTTLNREALSYSKAELDTIGPGGLSGKPLTKRSTEVIRYLKQRSGNAFPVIGVGGIHSADDALEKLEAGADLVQLYTGFIYEGPGLIADINKAILKKQQ